MAPYRPREQTKMVGTTTQARNAWNEAMRSATGSTQQPAARSNRRKRRDRARKSSSLSNNNTNHLQNNANGNGTDDIVDATEYHSGIRLDTLEGVVDSYFNEQQQMDDGEEYDELEDYTADDVGCGGRKRRKGNTKKGVKDCNDLSSILIEESSRVHNDGIPVRESESSGVHS